MKKSVILPICIMFLCSPLITEGVMMGLSTDQLVRASDVVITGQVDGVDCFWGDNGKTIYTRATIAVTDIVRGNISMESPRLIVQYEGGEVDGIGLKVSDAVTLKQGEEVLLFLKSILSDISQASIYDSNNTNVFYVVGKAQGKYTIQSNRKASKGGFSIYKGAELIDNDIDIEAFKAIIRGVK